MPPEVPTRSAAPQVLGTVGDLTGGPVVQAIAGTAAVIFEAAHVRVSVLGLESDTQRGVRFCMAQDLTDPNVLASANR